MPPVVRRLRSSSGSRAYLRSRVPSKESWLPKGASACAALILVPQGSDREVRARFRTFAAYYAGKLARYGAIPFGVEAARA